MAGCGRGSRGSGRRLEILEEEGAGVPGELGPAVAAEGLPVGPSALLGEALLEPGDLVPASWRQWRWTSRTMMVWPVGHGVSLEGWSRGWLNITAGTGSPASSCSTMAGMGPRRVLLLAALTRPPVSLSGGVVVNKVP